MKKLLLAIIAASAVVVSAPITANASLITYNLTDVTASYFNFSMDTIYYTGSFTFDTTSEKITSANISVAGAYPVPSFDFKIVYSSSSVQLVFVYVLPFYDYLRIDFTSPLSDAPDTLLDIYTNSADCNCEFIPDNPDGQVLTGSVDPTPLPAALPLFATGLGCLGLLGWRRKRRVHAAA